MVLEDARGQEHLGTPLKFRAEAGAPRLASPAHGAHTEELLGELGYDAAAIAALRAEGVC
jgi:formyl-CoA transferase